MNIDDIWILTETEKTLVMSKSKTNRLVFATLLLFYRIQGRFPNTIKEINHSVISYVAQQIGIDILYLENFDTAYRTWKRHCSEIRSFFGFRKFTVDDFKIFSKWLLDQVAVVGCVPENLKALLNVRCRELLIEPPSADRITRIVNSTISAYEENFYTSIYNRLKPMTRNRMNALLKTTWNEDNFESHVSECSPAILIQLRTDPGPPSLSSVQKELAKLEIIRQIELPADIFKHTLPQEIERYYRRVVVEAPYEMRRHSEATRLTWLAAFIYLRGRSLTDSLVDLLIETIHHIGARAERKVDRKLLEDIKRVTGKQNILFEIAKATVEKPDGIVREVVFPVASEKILNDLIKEWKATGPVYRTTLRTIIRNSYKGHYRRMVPQVLKTLEFRSNNNNHRPVIRALELVKQYSDSKVRTFPSDEDVPIDGVVRKIWREAVIEKDCQESPCVNRITYEICALESLRERLRCKEIWVVGANRYRNPDEDLPGDFDLKRITYYQALNLPIESNCFISKLQSEMREALYTLDIGLPNNPYVKISNKKQEGWITLTPLDAQPEPQNLIELKQEISTIWPMTNLLDMVKETDLRLNFTDALKSATTYETLDRAVLRPRLLLCLHGLGTNAGLQRMESLSSGLTYKDLSYVRRRYISPEVLRQAIAIVTNGTLHARNPLIWGDGTTACASDSKHFGAWDQNLTTQWHLRYGGRGIMIYWHVERKSLCIHSQLKSPSSSEVASMIEGVIHHCTEMEIDRQYVDSHGQSTVAFAFCHLLGFNLMPRLKAIYSQKLYRPDTGQPNTYPNLQLILSKPINWEFIQQQYDQMVKYATALRLGTAQTESILRRFTRNNIQHPTYKAFAELGKVIKTIFLCRYLHSEAVRREIHEGLNVIEQWNGANDFVFFARHGEFTSNRYEDHEISMLSLHLLQNCMIYINTLMIQQVLAKPHWEGKLTTNDLRALTPLIWKHINPYGRFELDMNTRLPLQ